MIAALDSGRVQTSSIGAAEFSSIALVEPPEPPEPPEPSFSSIADILKAVYDPVLEALRVFDVGPASGQIGSRLSNEKILQSVYEHGHKALRITIVPPA